MTWLTGARCARAAARQVLSLEKRHPKRFASMFIILVNAIRKWAPVVRVEKRIVFDKRCTSVGANLCEFVFQWHCSDIWTEAPKQLTLIQLIDQLEYGYRSLSNVYKRMISLIVRFDSLQNPKLLNSRNLMFVVFQIKFHKMVKVVNTFSVWLCVFEKEKLFVNTQRHMFCETKLSVVSNYVAI